jgi:hypothetical protein
MCTVEEVLYWEIALPCRMVVNAHTPSPL